MVDNSAEVSINFGNSAGAKEGLMGLDFVAVDFEIANHDPSSACAMGLAFVRGGHLTESTSYLIRPPSREFVFTYLHRLTWHDVSDAPRFCDLWDNLRQRLSSEILVAHNATFDKLVFTECLRALLHSVIA